MIFVSPKRLNVLKETALWLTGGRTRIKVAGSSMKPTLNDGEFVLINPNKVPQLGDLAVFDHPKVQGLAVIKRVSAIEDSGAFTVCCDNPDEGSDSRTWGPLAADSAHGVVTAILDRPSDSLLLDDEADSTD